MRRALRAALAPGLLAGALALGFVARAQEPPATPDVPPGPATIRGRVIHPERPEAVNGVDVVLYALPAQAPPGVRRTRADATGAFAFEGVSNDPETAYLVGARFADVPYAGERVGFSPGETERTLEVRIADVTPNPSGVRVREVEARIDQVGGELSVNETVRIENTGRATVFVPPAQRSPGHAAFATRLPAGARGFTMPLGIVPEGVVLAGEELAFFGPVYPGAQEITYGYGVPVAGATTPGTPARVSLDRRFGTALAKLVLLVPAQGPTARAPAGFAGPEEVSVEGRPYRRFAREAVAEGVEVAFALEVPAAVPRADTLAPTEVRLFFELDDAAVLVREEYHFTVPGSAPVVGAREAPLLRVPLPPDAQRLGFHPDYGLQPDPNGGVAVLGPVPPGESTLEITYRLPRGEGAVELGREFAVPVSLLSVYVADTGLIVDSARLHRRRPVRGEDRTFMHLEAFEVEAGETLPLRFAPLPPRRSLPRAGLVAVACLGGVAAIAFLSAPLRRRTVETELAAPAESAARRERESLVTAIRDLDHDYETGKVAQDDWRTFREELRARAMALLRQERDAAARPDVGAAASATAEPTCSACFASVRSDDRFCAQCGARLGAGPARAHEARG